MVANSSPEQREKILELFTDPRIIPYERQYVMGQSVSRPSMFEETGLIRTGQLQTCFKPGVYKIRVEVNKHIVVHYNGSATGAGGLDDQFCTHREIIRRGPIEIAALRKKKQALYIHQLCAVRSLSNATYTIHVVTTFPAPKACHDSPWQTKVLTLFLEACMMIYDDSLDKVYPRHSSVKILEHLRPKDMPKAQWYGANRVLPFQTPLGLAGALIDLKTSHILKTILHSYFLKYNTFYLDRTAHKEILKSLEAETGSHAMNSPAYKRIIRISYKELLQSLCQPVNTTREHRLLTGLPLLAVMKTWLVENDLVHGPFEGHYRLRKGMKVMNVDWGMITESVQVLVPIAQRGRWDSTVMYRKWQLFWNSFGEQFLYEPNWDAIPCTCKIDLRVYTQI